MHARLNGSPLRRQKAVLGDRRSVITQGPLAGLLGEGGNEKCGEPRWPNDGSCAREVMVLRIFLHLSAGISVFRPKGAARRHLLFRASVQFSAASYCVSAAATNAESDVVHVKYSVTR